MNENEIIFAYPDKNNEQEITNYFLKYSKYNRKRRTIICINVMLALVFFVISLFSNHAQIPFLITLALLFIMVKVMFSKKIAPQKLTQIVADEEKMIVKIADLSSQSVATYEIYYDDITKAIINKSLSRILIYYSLNGKSYSENATPEGEHIEKNQSDICLVPLDDYTYQQFFFLYIAPQYITEEIEKTSNADRYIEKKFGTEDDYLISMDNVSQKI